MEQSGCSYRGHTVTLTGEVRSAAERRAAEQATWAGRNVGARREGVNQRSPSRSLNSSARRSGYGRLSASGRVVPLPPDEAGGGAEA